jgi:hypothetical protein
MDPPPQLWRLRMPSYLPIYFYYPLCASSFLCSSLILRFLFRASSPPLVSFPLACPPHFSFLNPFDSFSLLVSGGLFYKFYLLCVLTFRCASSPFLFPFILVAVALCFLAFSGPIRLWFHLLFFFFFFSLSCFFYPFHLLLYSL